MNPQPDPHFSFEWSKDFYIRCQSGASWVDFGFDLGGKGQEFPLEKNPLKMSDSISEAFIKDARQELITHLEGIGYTVIDLPY